MAVKMFKLISIIDDTFDVDGKLEDLKIFTDAIERYDTMNFPLLCFCP